MRESFDLLEYFGHLRTHWRFLAVAAGVAGLVAAGISLAMPRKYTATVRMLIGPPAGGDPRIAVAVTPIYLESLRSYEHLAASDTLFLRALDQAGLRRDNEGPVESWKRRVVKTEVPRNTRVLQISVTLRDAKRAHALALFMAEGAVKLSQSVGADSDRPLVEAAEKEHAGARARLDRATAEWNRQAAEPVEGLAEDIRASQVLKAELERNVAFAELLIAENANREALLASTDAAAHRSELESIRVESRLARTRLAELRKQVRELDREVASRQLVLARRSAQREVLSSARRDAEAAYAAAETRLREVRGVSGFRGEQLTIIDRGIAPERPSSPSLPLNVIAALALGLTAGVVYLSLEFSLGRLRRSHPSLRVAG